MNIYFNEFDLFYEKSFNCERIICFFAKLYVFLRNYLFFVKLWENHLFFAKLFVFLRNYERVICFFAKLWERVIWFFKHFLHFILFLVFHLVFCKSSSRIITKLLKHHKLSKIYLKIFNFLDSSQPS